MEDEIISRCEYKAITTITMKDLRRVSENAGAFVFVHIPIDST